MLIRSARDQVFASLLLLFIAFFVLSRNAIGQNTNQGVSFDAVIEINLPRARSYELLFVRYWVSAREYRAAVIWAEPQGRGLKYPIYPPGLRVASDSFHFSVSHELLTNVSSVYTKPIGDRGVFPYRYGDYPIDNLRFADKEGAESRIGLGDLKEFRKTNNSPRNIPGKDGTSLEVSVRGGIIDSLELIGSNNNVLKRFNYDYAEEERGRIRQLRVTLEEETLYAGLQGKGATVTLRGKEIKVQKFPLTHHKGGRSCLVDYSSVLLDTNTVILPRQIRVDQGLSTNSVLRSARLSHFEPYSAESTDQQFTIHEPEYSQYRELTRKYRGVPAAKLSGDDFKAIRKVHNAFVRDEPYKGETPGERLRRLNALITLNELLADRTELLRTIGFYFDTLEENGFGRMTLTGGVGLIETAALRNRYEEANWILDGWLQRITPVTNCPASIKFAVDELQKGNLWIVLRFLEAIPSDRNTSITQQFEITAIRSVALSQLAPLFDNFEKGEVSPGSQIALARSAAVNKEDIISKLGESLARAQVLIGQISSPTPFQKKLIKRIELITKERRTSTRTLSNSEFR